MNSRPIIAVVSGCGGAGGSVFSAVLAGCAAARDGQASLLDCDAGGGGIDVLLGCEQAPGPRWSQVRLRGGPLEPDALRETLPRWCGVSFLAADTAAPLDPGGLAQVIEAAAASGPVVLDVGRAPTPARQVALARATSTVLISPAEVRGVTASALLAAGLDARHAGVVVRGSSRSLPAAQIGQLLGLTVLGELPYDPASRRPEGLQLKRVRRRTRAVAEAVLATTGPDEVESPPANWTADRPHAA